MDERKKIKKQKRPRTVNESRGNGKKEKKREEKREGV